VKVTPHKESVAVDATFLSKKSAQSGLSHEVLTYRKEGSRKVAATAEKDVLKKASGQILIYNNFSKDPQRLIKNTRFQTANGFIFRINESVVVPGMQNAKPGSIEVTIFADEAGKKYNVGLLDWSIPGFKSEPEKYAKIYGRSKTAMTGGFEGKMKVITDSDRDVAYKSIEAELKTTMLAEAKSQVPAKYLFFDKAVAFEFSKDVVDEESGDGLIVHEKGTLYAVIPDKAALTSAIGSKYIGGYKADGRYLENPASLDVSLVNDTQAKPWATDDVSIVVKGNATFVSIYDESNLKTALTSQSRKTMEKLLAQFPEIDSTEAVVRPFWRTTFPKNKDDIKIINTLLVQ
jgi:hypothetical protein